MVYQKDYDNSKVRTERVEARCPCGQIVKAVAIEGRVQGYCAVCGKQVEALVVHG